MNALGCLLPSQRIIVRIRRLSVIGTTTRSQKHGGHARSFTIAASMLQVTPEMCNTLAMGIIGVNGGPASAPAAATSYQPRTTNCSTYFGQTHCTTY